MTNHKKFFLALLTVVLVLIHSSLFAFSLEDLQSGEESLDVTQSSVCLYDIEGEGYMDDDIACPEGYGYFRLVGECLGTFDLCPEGQTLNEATGKCEEPFTFTCPDGYTVNGSRCDAPPVCLTPGDYSSSSDLCEAPLVGYSCPEGMTYSGDKTCVSQPECLEPGYFSPEEDKCLTNYVSLVCPEGMDFDGTQCVSDPICELGYYSPSEDKCIKEYEKLNCPSGMTFDGTKCFASPVCENGEYSTIEDRCLAPYASVTCPTGLNWDGTQCSALPQCASGSYSDILDKCVAIHTSLDCPTGLSFDGTQCSADPTCSSGTYSESLNICVAEYSSVTCPNGLSWNGSLCTTQPECPGGDYSSALDKCVSGYASIDCPAGLSFDGTQCSAEPSCAEGSYSTSLNKCISSYSSVTCPTGLIWDGNHCSVEPTCASGVYSATQDKCLADNNGINCPTGLTFDGTQCSAAPNCDVGIYSDTLNKCVTSFSYVSCPTGLSWNGSLCVASPTCANGTYSASQNKCVASYIKINCPTGLSWDGSQCSASPLCASGTYSTSLNLCTSSYSSVTCPSGLSWDGTQCSAPPICSGGSYSTSQNKCLADFTSRNCSTGLTWDGTQCSADPICSAGTYSASLNLCSANYTSVTCPSGFSWNGTQCVGLPVCTNGSYSATQNKCLANYTSVVCPSGFSWDGSKCISSPVCTGGGAYSQTNNVCLTDVASVIVPSGMVLSDTGDTYVSEPTCISPGSYDEDTHLCVAASEEVCGDGMTISGSNCVGAVQCLNGVGTYDSGISGCYTTTKSVTCPSGYTYNSTRQKCQKTPDCPNAGSRFNPETDKCETYSACDATFSNMGFLGDFVGFMEGAATWPSSGGLSSYRYLTDVLSYTGGAVDDIAINFDPYCRVDGYYIQQHPLYLLSVDVFDLTSTSWIYSGGTKKLGTFYVTNTTVPTSSSEPICSNGGVLRADYSVCIADAEFTCAEGFSYSFDYDQCEGPADCDGTVSGGICTEPATVVCPDDYTWDSIFSACIASSKCTGGILNASTGECSFTPASTDYVCPTGYSWSTSLKSCQSQASCSAGSLNTSSDQCEYSVSSSDYNCGIGYTWSSSLSKCTKPATCTSGSLDVNTDKCEYSVSTSAYNCPTGMTWNTSASLCTASSTCASGTLNTSSDRCIASESYSCPTGFAWNSSLSKCTKASTCAAGSLDAVSDRCEYSVSSSAYNCPSSMTWNGSLCTLSSSCASGSLNTSSDLCLATETYSCPSGMSWNSGLSLCLVSSTCVGGSLNITSDQCEYTAQAEDYNCPDGMSWDGTQCTSLPVCFSGVYSPSQDKCLASYSSISCPIGLSWDGVQCSASPICSVGSYSTSLNLCTNTYSSVTCPTNFSWDGSNCVAAPTCSSGSYSASLNKCVSTYASRNCPEGLSWDGTQCSGAPNCSVGSYSTSLNLCTTAYSSVTCPTNFSWNGSQCVAAPTCINGTYSTSQNKCLANYTSVSCPTGYSWDGSQCVGSPVCSNGTYSGTNNLCTASFTSVAVPAGMVLSDTGDSYIADPTCISPGIYDATKNLCVYEESYSCSAGQTWNGSLCTASPICASTGSYNTTLDVCQLSASYSCPTGMTLSGSTCVSTPTCNSGYEFDTTSNSCASEKSSASEYCAVSMRKSDGTVIVSNSTVAKGGYFSQYRPLAQGVGVLDRVRFDDNCHIDELLFNPEYGSLGNADDTILSLDLAYGETIFSYFLGSSTGNYWQNDSVPSITYESAICPTGASVNSSTHQCNRSATISCATGYTWSSSQSKCVASATCASGSLNTTSNLCQEAGTPVCDNNYSWNSSYSKCTASPKCSGGILNASTSECTFVPASTDYSCPTGYSWSTSIALCTKSAVCTSGLLDINSDKCKYTVSTSAFYCPAGMVWSSSLSKCVATASCSAGSLNTSTDQCQYSVSNSAYNCPTGMSWNATSSVCTKSSTCTSGILDVSTDACEASESYSCPASMSWNSSLAKCTGSSSCSAGSLNTSSDQCVYSVSSLAYNCPTGMTWNASKSLCTKSSTCSSGTLNTTNDRCLATQTYNCTSGSTWNSSLSKCVSSASCPAGSLDVSSDKCELALDEFSDTCPTGTTLSGSICIKPSSCPSGALDANSDLCLSNETYSCASGNWNETLQKCVTPASCANGSLSTSTDLCLYSVSAADYVCPSGMTWDSSNSKCVQSSSCISGTLDVVSDQCLASESYNCPTGLTWSVSEEKCYGLASCVGGALDTSSDTCTYDALTTDYICPGDMVWSSSYRKCTTSSECVSGSLNIDSDLCLATEGYSCESGMTWDSSVFRCVAPSSCVSGSLDIDFDHCVQSVTDSDFNCVTGMAWDSDLDQCSQNSTCVGGSLNTIKNRCEETESYTCLPGFVWDWDLMRCTNQSYCIGGGLNVDTDLCENPVLQYNCSDGYTWSYPLMKCEVSSTCVAGELDIVDDRCEEIAIEVCDTGFIWDAILNTCVVSSTCELDGVLNTSDDLCVRDADKTCFNGLVLNEFDICEADVVCQLEGVFDFDYINCTLGEPEDTTPPELFFTHECNKYEGGPVIEKEYLSLLLVDNLDVDPQLTSLHLSGGPNNIDIDVPWAIVDGLYVFEIPPIMPSNGSPYILSASAIDWQDNAKDISVEMLYTPRVNTMNNDGSILYVPASTHAFSRKDGTPPIESKYVRDEDDEKLQGIGGLWAILPANAPIGVVVDGVTVNPGQTVLVDASYDLDAHSNKIESLVSAINNGDTGNVTLYLTTDISYSEFVQVDMNFWDAENISIAADSWDIMQLLDKVNIKGKPSEDMPCSVSGSDSQSQAANVFTYPICYLEWDSLIDDLELSSIKPPVWSGRGIELGEHVLTYRISLFDADGTKYEIGTGTRTLTVSPITDFKVEPDQDISHVYAKVQTVQFYLEQTEGTACSLTTDAEVAKEVGEDGNLKCLVKFDVMPDALSEKIDARYPTITGTISEAGAHTFQYSVYGYSKKGTEIALGTFTYEMVADLPPKPEVTVKSQMDMTESGLYVAEIYGGNFGFVQFSVPAAAANITLLIKGTANGTESSQYITRTYVDNGKYKTFSRLLRVGESEQLWENDEIYVKVSYTDCPEIYTEDTYHILRVPPEDTRLLLSTEGEGIDTVGVPVKAEVGTLSGSDMIYDSAIHGNWYGEFGKYYYGDFEPLMDSPVLMEEGELDVTVSGVESGRMSMVAQAQITSPNEEYSRTIMSNRRYITVFRGDYPEADIVTLKYSGPVPYTTSLTLKLDAESYAVLGDVDWQLSEDEKATWTSLSNGISTNRKTVTFEEPGIYYVRALVTNSKTGAQGYTETIQINAYRQVDLDITGSKVLFTGTPVELNANPTVNGEPVEDVVVEWLDLENNLIATGPIFNKTYSERTTLMLNVRARAIEAPEDDRRAWTKKRKYIKIFEPAAPRGRLYVPYYMEALKEYELQGSSISLPYPGMNSEQYPISGEWTLPDGSVVEGLDITYTPSEELAIENDYIYFTFTAWIDGYKDAGAVTTTTRKVRLGRYVWPEFTINSLTYMNQAPASYTLTVKPIDYTGSLLNPVYTWHLPESVTIDSISGKKAIVSFTEPGTFDVSVDIIDDRGSEAFVETTITVEEASPFVLEPVYTVSNEYLREPLSVKAWLRISGGHPYDRMTQFEYTIEGESVDMIGRVGVLKDLAAGEYTLHMQGTSNYGVVSEVELPISVVQNQKPICSIDKQTLERSTGTVYLLTATCEDFDGKISGYNWYVDDTENNRISTAYRVAITAPEEGLTRSVRLKVIDNSLEAVDYYIDVP